MMLDPRRAAAYRGALLTAIGLVWILHGCAETPKSTLPPSASDLVLLTTARLCDSQETVLSRSDVSVSRLSWGSGVELRISAPQGAAGSEESYFFDSDGGVLVGALFLFPTGLPLKPYPVLRKTLLQLRPIMEFYLPSSLEMEEQGMSSGTLYMTGDVKSTTQYVVNGEGRDQRLLLASFALDPYVNLLAPYRAEFLARFRRKSVPGAASPATSTDMKEAMPALQHFARGQTAQLGFCRERDYEGAAKAYRQALEMGFTDKVWIAETHHRLGLALEGQGRLLEAREELEKSLALRPNIPEVLNNIGNIQAKLGDRDKAIKTFERAVTLRPNYPLARYNLAEAYETINGKRAIQEYETYLALVEGIPDEADRAARARERVKALKR